MWRIRLSAPTRGKRTDKKKKKERKAFRCMASGTHFLWKSFVKMQMIGTQNYVWYRML